MQSRKYAKSKVMMPTIMYKKIKPGCAGTELSNLDVTEIRLIKLGYVMHELRKLDVTEFKLIKAGAEFGPLRGLVLPTTAELFLIRNKFVSIAAELYNIRVTPELTAL